MNVFCFFPSNTALSALTKHTWKEALTTSHLKDKSLSFSVLLAVVPAQYPL